MDSTAHVFIYSLHSVNKLLYVPSVLTWDWYRAMLFRKVMEDTAPASDKVTSGLGDE